MLSTKTFQAKDIVYFDDVRLIVMAGPYRDWYQPNVDKYVVAYAGLEVSENLWGKQGYYSAHRASDLMTEDEYHRMMTE